MKIIKKKKMTFYWSKYFIAQKIINITFFTGKYVFKSKHALTLNLNFRIRVKKKLCLNLMDLSRGLNLPKTGFNYAPA